MSVSRDQVGMSVKGTGRKGTVMEKVINICLRGISGTIAVYFINSVLAGMGISLGVGINLFTVLTSAILGFPGVIALYAVGVYRIL